MKKLRLFAPMALIALLFVTATVQAAPISAEEQTAVIQSDTSPQITNVNFDADFYVPDAVQLQNQQSFMEGIRQPEIVGGALNVNLVNNEIDKFQSQNTEVALAKDSDLLVNQNDTSPGNSTVDIIVQSDATKVKAYVDDSSGVAVNSSNFAQNNLLAATALEKDSGQQNLLNGNNKATGVIVFTSDQPQKARA